MPPTTTTPRAQALTGGGRVSPELPKRCPIRQVCDDGRGYCRGGVGANMAGLFSGRNFLKGWLVEVINTVGGGTDQGNEFDT